MTLINAKQEKTEIDDLDEQPNQKLKGGGVGGLNLGGLEKVVEQPSEAQYSMKIGNNNISELPPQLRRGEDFDA